jgi:dienelactone hydrolase
MFKKLIIVSFLMSVQVNAQTQNYDVKHSWDNAEVHVPGKWFSKSVNNINHDIPLPTVIYLHGCAGISDPDRMWAGILKQNGFIVVMPDSFSIPGREKNCDLATKNTNLRKVPTAILRPKEAEYAIEQILKLPWVDKNNIFLMGHSEGGMGVSRTITDKVKGIVVSGFPCATGIWADAKIPVLAIGWSHDEWFKDRFNYKQCDSFWGERKNSSVFIINGTSHRTADVKEFNQVVISFLKRLVDEK